MGLDVSHETWHGGYPLFNAWRDQIAEAAGYMVCKTVIFDDENRPSRFEDMIMLDWGHIPEETFVGEWEEVPPDPLLILFCHSDCDGIIHWEHAELLANRLEELLPGLCDEAGIKNKPGETSIKGGTKSKTEIFIKGLRLAVSRKEDLKFE